MKRFCLLLVLVVGACDDRGRRTDGAVALAGDSAGVTIIQSSPPYLTWSIDPSPVTAIGVVEGDPDHQLSEVAYAARLSDGRVVLFDGGSSEVRWYGADGRFQFRTGGRGEGPGEFRRFASAALTARDTLVVYDYLNQRLTWVGPEGSISRTRRVALGSGSRIDLVPLAQGRLLIAEERPTLNYNGSEFNYARDSLLGMVTSSSTEAVDTILRLPGREAVTWVDYVDGRPRGTRQMDLPFGQMSLVGATSDGPVVIRAGRSDLAFFDGGGDLVGSARRSDVAPPAVSADLREQYVTKAVEQGVSAGMQEDVVRGWSEARIGLLPEDRKLPAFDKVLADPVQDRVWVRDFLPEWRSEEARDWTAHDSTGRAIARATTPPGLVVTHVASSYLVGVERDEMGVEYVVVYTFE